jgi:hypothetical protein
MKPNFILTCFLFPLHLQGAVNLIPHINIKVVFSLRKRAQSNYFTVFWPYEDALSGVESNWCDGLKIRENQDIFQSLKGVKVKTDKFSIWQTCQDMPIIIRPVVQGRDPYSLDIKHFYLIDLLLFEVVDHDKRSDIALVHKYFTCKDYFWDISSERVVFTAWPFKDRGLDEIKAFKL